jgi:HEAT repeat protein
MDPNENPITVSPESEPQELSDLEDVRKPTSLLVAQFFLFPLIIIAFGVGIFVLFGYLAYEESSPEEYLTVVRNSGGYFDRQRWQAAAQLVNIVSSDPEAYRGTALADQVLDVYIEAQTAAGDATASNYQDPLMEMLALDPDESQLRRFLAMTLGELEHRPAVPALSRGLADPDPEAQIWTMWSLGKIGDPAGGPAVAELAGSADTGVRQTAVYVLGVLGNHSTLPTLRESLGDPAPNVRWTSAMSLAQMGDASGAAVLIEVTDRDYFSDFEEMSDEDKENVITSAIHCLGLLRLDHAKDHLAMLSTGDPSLKVRDAALAALALY